MSAQASQSPSGDNACSPVAGRRRARLIQGAVKAANPQALTVADVQALQDDPSPASRAVLAGKFGRQYEHLVEGDTRTLAEAVLDLLARDTEKRFARRWPKPRELALVCPMGSRCASRAMRSRWRARS